MTPGRVSEFGTAFPPEGEDAPDADLWFLPGPDLAEAEVPPGVAPLPRAARDRLFDPAKWRRAQDSLSGELAGLTQIFGELDARLRGGPDGMRQRLALREATDLSWWVGDRLSLDRLALWSALRIGSTADTEQALARAGWALRRLRCGPAPASGLTNFLERPLDGVGSSAAGADPGAVADLAGLLSDSADLHWVTQSALLFHAWRVLGAPWTRDIEAAVLAARHAASMCRRPGQGALFLPLAMTGTGGLQGQGDPARKLAAWIAGAEQATLAALLQVERVSGWKQAAQAAVADLSGRTPGRLIEVFAAWPLVSAPLAEAEAGASRAAIQRNLDRLVTRGVIREVTGQGRFRIWAAKL